MTFFNDNAAITYLSSLVTEFSSNHALQKAVLSGAVTGGGLTVIANAPNPAGQSILSNTKPTTQFPNKLSKISKNQPSIPLFIPCFCDLMTIRYFNISQSTFIISRLCFFAKQKIAKPQTHFATQLPSIFCQFRTKFPCKA